MIAANDNRLQVSVSANGTLSVQGPCPRFQPGVWYAIDFVDGPANGNRAPITPAERAVMVEAILEEFDLLCLGFPSPDRIEREIALRTLH